MRRKFIYFIKIMLFVFGLSLLLWKTYGVLSWKDTSGDYVSSTQQLYHTPENTMDVVFLGSSHCYCSSLPNFLWESDGISAFDMAISGQDKSTTVHALQELLKTQKTKVVMVEMYGLCFERQLIDGNEYRNMLSLKPSLNSVQLVREYIEPERQKDFLLRWPIIHTRFWEVGKYDYVTYAPSIYGRSAGFSWYVGGAVSPGEYLSEEIGVLTENNKKWLERLVKLKKEYDFELVCYLAPFQAKKEDMLQINAAKEFARDNGIPFLDLNRERYELGLKDDEDYLDEYHCNTAGAKKVTDAIGEYLKKNYSLKDHRGEEAYHLWELDSQWYHHEEFADRLENGTDMEKLIEELALRKDIYCVISIDFTDFDIDRESYAKMLKPLKLEKEDVLREGKWIYHNGELTKIMENGREGKEFCIDLSDTDSMRIRYTDVRNPSDIRINYTDYLLNIAPVTIVNYDEFLEEPIHSLYF